ncbi:MAG: GtrA family protein [Candidatus Sungbacteria bacterium]|nr:GtrA family protein [Candidatus Sungbacteria bacterium]
MTSRNIFIGLIIGFLIGLFAIPSLQNSDLIQKIPSPYLVLLVALPVAAAVGVALAEILGRWVPIVWQAVKFGIVGVLNTTLDFGVLNILILATGFEKGLPLAILNVGSFAAAVTNSYFWNRRWVFGGASGNEVAKFAEFIVVSLVGAIISSAMVGSITQYFTPPLGLSGAQWANVAKAAAVLFAMVWNFLGYKFVVFRRRV